jgi:hypothetical protein
MMDTLPALLQSEPLANSASQQWYSLVPEDLAAAAAAAGAALPG